MTKLNFSKLRATLSASLLVMLTTLFRFKSRPTFAYLEMHPSIRVSYWKNLIFRALPWLIVLVMILVILRIALAVRTVT